MKSPAVFLPHAPRQAFTAGILVKYAFFVKIGFGKDYLSGLFEGIRTRKKCTRVPDLEGRLKEELIIQAELFFGTCLYVYEFSRRQVAKVRK